MPDVTVVRMSDEYDDAWEDGYEEAREGLLRELIDWCEANVTNYGERSCVQRHLRSLQKPTGK